MEERSSNPPTGVRQAIAALGRRDGVWLLLLLTLTGCIHAWMIEHTAVAARDSIGFIRYAWELESRPWEEVVRAELHPPLYPLTVLAVSLPVRHLLDVNDSLAMQYSAQLASTLAGVLLVIPMFYLGRALFDRRVGFWSALLFHCLPVSSRALSDGLTEGIYLLLTATLFLFALRGLRDGSFRHLGVCGLCGGLAYLARPEGALLIVVTGAVLLGMQCLPAWRKPWRRTLAGLASLTVCALAVALPYMATIGGLTNKTSSQWLWQSLRGRIAADDADLPTPSTTDADILPAAVRSPVPLASIWSAWVPRWSIGNHTGQLGWSVKQFVKEVGKGFHYAVWLPALLGLWWFRARIRDVPGVWLMLLVCLLQSLFLLRLAVVAGYLSERHSAIFVLCGVPWAVAGMRAMPRKMSMLGGRLSLPRWIVCWGGRRRLVEMLFLIALTIYGLPSTLKTLHPTRAGFREAGLWLAENGDSSAAVLDPFCWTHYYAGRVFQDKVWPPIRYENQPFSSGYVVLDNIYSSEHHSHLPLLPRAKQLAKTGRLVYHWPTQRPVWEGRVFVYAVEAP